MQLNAPGAADLVGIAAIFLHRIAEKKSRHSRRQEQDEYHYLGESRQHPWGTSRCVVDDVKRRFLIGTG